MRVGPKPPGPESGGVCARGFGLRSIGRGAARGISANEFLAIATAAREDDDENDGDDEGDKGSTTADEKRGPLLQPLPD